MRNINNLRSWIFVLVAVVCISLSFAAQRVVAVEMITDET